MKHLHLLLLPLLISSCHDDNLNFNATGTFEATEVTLSAEQNGRLISLTIQEGDPVSSGDTIALTDTLPLHLKLQQIQALAHVYASQRPDTRKQSAALQEQLAKARQDYDRFNALIADGAANRKQLDDADAQVRITSSQLDALLSSLATSTNSLNAQIDAAQAESRIVLDQLHKCHVTSPISGIVIAKYAQQGEFLSTGRPILKVADLDDIFLRAYITSSQLSQIKLGQEVIVYADYGDNITKAYPGHISWISSKSEFTPKTILTNDERADLVYAVKVAVHNDGEIKIGMYGKLKF